MRRCPKCGLEYVDDSKICRACGAILDDVDALAETTPFEPAAQSPWLPNDEDLPPAEPQDEAWLPEDDEIPLPAPAAGDWICTTCGERVPATFDVCWNCATAESPLTAAAPTSAVAPAVAPVEAPPKYPRRQCAACGSTRIIRGAALADTREATVGTLVVVVDADPHALIFKNRRREELLADVCGDCGRVELRVQNHDELYNHYRSSQE